MGTDYSNYGGVEFTVSDFEKHFIVSKTAAQTKRLIKAINDCISESDDLQTSLNEEHPGMEIKTFEDVQKFWKIVTEYEGEAGKYEGDMRFTFWGDNEPYGLSELVGAIAEAEGFMYPDSVRIFDSYRQHAEMTVGEPVIIYSSDSVWEKTLSQSGKKLEKMKGETYLYESNWTEVSY
ncbi:MAG: hypothetical protein VB862_13120 [Pirellulaceae bacterium]